MPEFNADRVIEDREKTSSRRETVEGRELDQTSQVEPHAARASARERGPLFGGLRGRLFMLVLGYVLIAVLLLFPLLAGAHRDGWLREHAQAAEIASLAVQAAPDGRVSEELSRQLLDKAQVFGVAVVAADFRELVLEPPADIDGPVIPVDLREETPLSAAAGALSHLFAPPGRFLLLRITPSLTTDEEMEILVPEAALKRSLMRFSRNLLVGSMAIASLAGAVMYFAIYGLVVRPMRGLTDAVVRFSEAPDAPVSPEDISARQGGAREMRRAFDALGRMQQTVSAAFRQRKRLAELGEAVAKINHDLRNSLSAAQLVSEGLSHSEDPRVRRAAPRLERAIERAIGLAEATLKYGRAAPPEPRIAVVALAPVIEEAAAEALSAWPGVKLDIAVPAGLKAMADADHLHRIIANLARNAGQAMCKGPGEAAADEPRLRIVAERSDAQIAVSVSDNGPGVPEKLLLSLFQPFATSGTRDGSGLGLAVSRELARGMKGDLKLAKSDGGGAMFELRLPAA
ncbi:MAG: HAMP domain-containing sensor histidine kinase [Hyphomonadaceae bacterium]